MGHYQSLSVYLGERLLPAETQYGGTGHSRVVVDLAKFFLLPRPEPDRLANKLAVGNTAIPFNPFDINGAAWL